MFTEDFKLLALRTATSSSASPRTLATTVGVGTLVLRVPCSWFWVQLVSVQQVFASNWSWCVREPSWRSFTAQAPTFTGRLVLQSAWLCI